MSNIDPDVLQALKALAATGESEREQKIRAKHDRQAEARFETQLELLADEVEQVIPREHPDFINVLFLAVLSKVARGEEKSEAQNEFKSHLEFPNGW